MANFDALRPATLGALSYLSRETGGGGGGQTVEVVGCWPFVENGLDIVGSANYTVNSFLTANLDTYARMTTPDPSISLPDTYSFETLFYMNGDGINNDYLQVGSLKFYRTQRQPTFNFRITGSNAIEIATGMLTQQTFHYGIVKTSGKYKCYLNGVYKGEVNVPTTETQTLLFSKEASVGFRNARLCVGDITQNGVFPIRKDWCAPFTIENCHIIGGG